MGRFKYQVIWLIIFLYSSQALALEYTFKILSPGESKVILDSTYRCYDLEQFKELIKADFELFSLREEKALLSEKIIKLEEIHTNYVASLGAQLSIINILEEENKRLSLKWEETDKALQKSKANVWPWVVAGIFILSTAFLGGFAIAKQFDR